MTAARAGTDARGLSADDVAQRVAAGAVNVMPDRSGRSVADIIRANVFTRINAILGVLFAIVAFTGSFINGLFGLLIVANSGIGIIQEVRAKRTLDKLAIVGQTRPRVRRDGEVRELAPDEVVLDDIIEIGAGDQIVVDGEVVEAVALDVDESLLTGEADPVDKDPGAQVLSGSFVVAGGGAYRATKVGADAYAAQLAAEACNGKCTSFSKEVTDGHEQERGAGPSWAACAAGAGNEVGGVSGVHADWSGRAAARDEADLPVSAVVEVSQGQGGCDRAAAYRPDPEAGGRGWLDGDG